MDVVKGVQRIRLSLGSIIGIELCFILHYGSIGHTIGKVLFRHFISRTLVDGAGSELPCKPHGLLRMASLGL